MNEEHEELIRAGVAAWNAWRQDHSDVVPDLKHAVVSDLDLRAIDLSNAQLQGCDFTGTILTSANLGNAKAEGAVFRGCRFSHAACVAADLSGADFSNTKRGYQGADYLRSGAPGIDMRSCNLSNAKLTRAILSKADLRGAIIRTTNFTDADLRGSDLRGAQIVAAKFIKTRMSGCNMSSAVLTRCSLNGSNLRSAALVRTDFSDAVIRGASMRGALLDGAVFGGTQLTDIDFSNIRGNEVDFSGADARRAKLENAVLERSNFNGADLRYTNLLGARLDESDLDSVRLFAAQTEGWSVADVRCAEAYWDEDAIECTRYKDGEFATLYTSREAIELHYAGGISPIEIDTLPLLIRELEGLQEGTVLRLKSVEAAPGGAKVTIAIDESSALDPVALRRDLQGYADRLQVAQRRLAQEKKMRAIVEQEQAKLQQRLFPLLLEKLDDIAPEADREITGSILFMDLAEFSRLPSVQQESALHLLQGLVKPVLEQWRALHVNMWGDALRAVFRNVNDALHCATSMQKILTAAELSIRIGLHFGELRIANNVTLGTLDVHGDAVSFAARLEPLAENGGILVSKDVRYHESIDQEAFSFKEVSLELKKAVGELEAGEPVTCFVVDVR